MRRGCRSRVLARLRRRRRGALVAARARRSTCSRWARRPRPALGVDVDRAMRRVFFVAVAARGGDRCRRRDSSASSGSSCRTSCARRASRTHRPLHPRQRARRRDARRAAPTCSDARFARRPSFRSAPSRRLSACRSFSPSCGDSRDSRSTTSPCDIRARRRTRSTACRSRPTRGASRRSSGRTGAAKARSCAR